MNIGHFNTHDLGGAGKAAIRLNEALNRIGEDSKLFVKFKETDNKTIVKVDSKELNNILIEDIARHYFHENIKEGATLASVMYPGIGEDYLENIRNLDIINLHWIAGFISLENIVQINKLNKPIVWTLHDQNPFTGVCHYTDECVKYRDDCSNCPQLVNDEFNIASKVLELKVNNMPKDIVIVTPSRWLAEVVKESKVFKNNRVEVIPNSLDTTVFRAIEKGIAKRELGIEADVKIILFGAGELTERRKGFKYLLEATQYLKQDIYIQELLKQNKLLILTFGRNNEALDDMNVPYRQLNYIQDEEELAYIYSAADVMVIPSLQDNLPNTMLESMACGTPVVGFNVGGLKDCIIEDETGYLCEKKDVKNLALNTVKAIRNSSLSNKCREVCLEKYTFKIQANAYKDLYLELLKEQTEKYAFNKKEPYIFSELSQEIILYASELYNSQREELIKTERLYLNAKNYYTKLDERVIILSGENNKLNNINNELQITNNNIKSKLDELLSLKVEIEDEIIRLNQDNARINQDNTRLNQDNTRLNQDNIRLNNQLENIYSSKSWKITKPLRSIKNVMIKAKKPRK